MIVVFWVLGALLVWQVIGCFVLAYLDRPEGMNGRLLVWAERSPLPGFGLAATLWPWVLYKVATSVHPAKVQK